MRPLLENRNGLTVVEILVGTGVIAVILTVSFLMLANYRSERDLELTADEIVAALRSAQNRSITQEDGQQWGVQFTNTAADRYEIFKGPNYASGTAVGFYPLRRTNVIFIDPADGGDKEIVFRPATGLVDSYFSVTLGLTNAPTKQRVVEVTAIGKMGRYP
jgi:hypothetical protein